MVPNKYEGPPSAVGKPTRYRNDADRRVTVRREDERVLYLLDQLGSRVAEIFETEEGGYTMEPSGAGIPKVTQPIAWDDMVDVMIRSAAGN